uniref:Sushi domain containing 6 n=1 Tax=Neogobius melanostomus TaxID=47308 RepID=A0A8C6UVN2_9GOBI
MCDGIMGALSSPPSLTAAALLLLCALLPHDGHASGCARPPGVQHGDLLNQTEANRGSFPPGTLLSYSCEPGYTPEGPVSIICTSRGTWSHPPPRCQRNDGEGTGANMNRVCLPPTEPENGGYRCHPSPCHRLTHKTVIEYFCDEGYALKGDYKFLTCQNGEWDAPMQVSCRLTQDKPASPLEIPALSIVASTASSVALILLLVVLFVLVQPKLKSFHHSRREQGVSGQAGSLMVEGVQVALPSYEEAVYGNSSEGAATPAPPSAAPETRVPIVLSEGLPQGATGGAALHTDFDYCLPSTSSSSYSRHSRHAETVLVHHAPSSSWAREHPGGACAAPIPLRRDSESSDQHSLLSVTSTDDYSDDIPLLKEA